MTMKDYRSKAKAVLYQSDEEVRSALVHICIYICFLVVTTIVALSVRHLYMFYFNKTIENLFLHRGIFMEVESNFDLLVTTYDWWTFLEEDFLPYLHGKGGGGQAYGGSANNSRSQRRRYSSPKDMHSPHKGRIKRDTKPANITNNTNNSTNITTSSEDRKLLEENLLLGPVRLRQMRVLPESCKVHDAFDRYFNSCYAEYAYSIEDRKLHYKGTQFYTMSQLGSRAIWGRVDTYYGAGYVQYLTFDYTQNKLILSELKNIEWIDRATRIMIVEFGLYNANTALFDNVKFIAEMPPIGGIITSSQLQSLMINSFWTSRDYGLMVAASIFYVLIFYYTIEEVIEIVRFGLCAYLKHFWNYVDFAIIVCGHLSLAYTIWHSIYLHSLLARVKARPNNYENLDEICFWNMIFVDMMAICAFCTWIKLFKYISFNKTLLQFSVTLRRCSKDLLGFGMMFLIVFIAYAMLGLLLFGDYHMDFRNFHCAFLTLMRMILGDFNYVELEHANRILGPIYFLTYILLVFFILLNMFLAIINDTYTSVKNEVKKGHNHLEQFIAKTCKRFYKWLRDKCKCCRSSTVRNKSMQDPLDVNNKLSEMGSNVSTMPPTSATTIPDTSTAIPPTTTGPLRMRESELINEYFEEIPDSNPYDADHIKRLTNRIALVEGLLEELVNRMDFILKRIDGKKHMKNN